MADFERFVVEVETTNRGIVLLVNPKTEGHVFNDSIDATRAARVFQENYDRDAVLRTVFQVENVTVVSVSIH